MFRFLRKHRTVLFVTLAFCLIGMLFFGIGANSLHSSPQDTIAKVNGEKITQIQFDRIYNNLTRQKKEELTPEERFKLNGQAFNELIREYAFDQEAKKYKIIATDQELQMVLANTQAFQKEGKFDGRTYFETLQQVMGMPPSEFEKMRKKDLAAQKLNQIITSAVQISDLDLQNAVQEQLKIETDKKKIKELQENPEGLREELRSKELNIVFKDWLTQLNTNLKVNIVSDTFRKRLSTPPPASAPAAAPVPPVPVRP